MAEVKNMFAERVSLEQEMSRPDFAHRMRLSACDAIPARFHCHVNELDVQRVLLYNGFLALPSEVPYVSKDSDGMVLIHIPAGCCLEKPLQIVNLFDAYKPAYAQTRCRVVLEQNAQAILLQCTDSAPDTDVLAHTQTEIRLEAGAQLEYLQLQNVGNKFKLFHDLKVYQASDSQFKSCNINLNGGMTQTSLEVNLNQTRARAELLGLYLEDHEQVVSNQVKVNHLAPETYSRELFKGVMDDASSAWFKGHVYVHPEAQRTEAYQTCRNLLVSEKASANAKPYLEIYADDVQCNHGVTVGQLDSESLFYMRSRGIPADTARRLLMRAYADEILNAVSVESIRLWMVNLVKQRFSGQLQACQNCALSCPNTDCFTA